MSSINTKKYRTFLSQQFANCLSSNTSMFYLGVGRPQDWTNDNSPPTPTQDTQSVDFEYWRDMLAVKRVDVANTSYVIPRRDWSSNTVYAQYDDTSTSLFSNNFYVLDTTDAPFKVYKCLWNNNGGNSTVAPSTTGNNVSPVATADGYVWQYMYDISTDKYKFLTNSWMPVSTNGTVSAAAAAVPGKLPTTVPFIMTSNGSGFNPAGSFTVAFTGDGNGAVVNASSLTITSNAVTKILPANGGIGYTTVNTVIVQQAGAVNATARAIIPPYPNHGYNAQKELGGSAIMLTGQFEYDEDDELTTINNYRRILLLTDPLLANGSAANGNFYKQTFDLTLTSNTGVFAHDDVIRVSSNVSYVVTGIVVDVVASGNNNVVRVTAVNDQGRANAFVTGDTITCNVSGVEGVISTVSLPELKFFTGNILYVDQRSPVTRGPDQVEEIKLVFQFG